MDCSRTVVTVKFGLQEEKYKYVQGVSSTSSPRIVQFRNGTMLVVISSIHLLYLHTPVLVTLQYSSGGFEKKGMRGSWQGADFFVLYIPTHTHTHIRLYTVQYVECSARLSPRSLGDTTLR